MTIKEYEAWAAVSSLDSMMQELEDTFGALPDKVEARYRVLRQFLTNQIEDDNDNKEND